MVIRSVRDLGALVRDRRNALGWSQTELAERVGVRRLWISQFEGGKTTAQIGLVMRTLQELDLKLWAGDGPMASPSSKATRIDLDAHLKSTLNRDKK